jgi:4,5-DOPA dioxygenase extradiol
MLRAVLTRRAVLGLAGAMALGACQRRRGSPEERPAMSTIPATAGRLPVLFVGHGSPMNAIEDNQWSAAMRALGATLPAPRAIVAVSAHWYTRGTLVMANAAPETIHDFGGFPRALFEVQYPARGDRDVAARVRTLLADRQARLDESWGLDHGTWSVLVHTHPRADVPVLQLSIDGTLPPAAHLELGRQLAPLRDEGVLILGSGNLTHNLRHAMGAMRSGDSTTPAWAARFDAAATAALRAHDTAALAALATSADGQQAHPSLDHYLPLLYVAGAATEADAVTFPIEGWDAGSLSMRSVRLG